MLRGIKNLKFNKGLLSLQFDGQKYELNNLIVKFCQMLLNYPRRRLTEQYSLFERLSGRC